MKICALSVACIDIYPESGEEYIGGNSLNFLNQCAKIIEPSNLCFVGAIGRDSHGSMIVDFLKSLKIPLTGLQILNGTTASNRIFISKEGNRYFKPDSWSGGAFEQFRLKPEHFKLIHQYDIVALPATVPDFENILKKLDKHIKVVVDYLDTDNLECINKHKERVNISLISGNTETEKKVREIYKQSDNIAIVTKGEHGSVAFRNNVVIRQQAEPVGSVTDTTGCGDTFLAAFTISYYIKGSIEKALKSGAEAAAKVLQVKGGIY